MFTVCPRCALSLAVTAADLRVGQGYVRCGRCASVFNALATLSDDAIPAASDLERTWEPEESLEFTLGSEEVGRIFVEAPPDDPDLGTGTFESIVLAGDTESETLAAGASDEAAPAEPAPAEVAPADAAEEPEQPEREPAQKIVWTPPPPAVPAAEEMFEEPEPLTEPSRFARWAAAARSAAASRWALPTGIAFLTLLLLAQWTHHRRNDLAAIPALGAPLAAVYRALGSPLAPRWDLRAYEVRQLGAATGPEAPGHLTVRASVRNGAPRAQPLPVLRLKLHDRYGSVVAGRDLAPAEYLGSRMPADGHLEAGQRADAEIAILDPGNDAVGFEIDACLPSAAGRVRCAADLVAQAP